MRDLFPGYYRPTQESFKVMWENGIFVLDANVLLLPYRSTPVTWQRFSEVLELLKNRIWIPHQVAYEYQKNRANVIAEQKKIYDKVRTDLDSIQKVINGFNNYRHQFIEFEALARPFEIAIKRARKTLKNIESEHPDLNYDDPFRDFFDKTLDGRFGVPYSDRELEEKRKLAEARYKIKVPPGYADAEEKKKKGEDPYGDAILWMQVLDYAKTEQKPIIFVTDEQKEDWWSKQPTGPRPELGAEIQSEAGVGFYMYRTPQFIDYAGSYLELARQPEVIEELEEIGQEVQAVNLNRVLSNQQIAHLAKQLYNKQGQDAGLGLDIDVGVLADIGMLADPERQVWDRESLNQIVRQAFLSGRQEQEIQSILLHRMARDLEQPARQARELEESARQVRELIEGPARLAREFEEPARRARELMEGPARRARELMEEPARRARELMEGPARQARELEESARQVRELIEGPARLARAEDASTPKPKKSRQQRKRNDPETE